ncbi:MAG: PD-(D/E)XK nuclease family protein [Prevotella sp.]|nr:PD-(D/E)XK nuclease family protein [Candidatus Prevotella equi]
MTSFLNTVANDLLAKHGEDLSRITIIFPNKRASLFMNNILQEQCTKPIWSPQYTTISDLFRRHSKLQVADRIQLICELHKAYTKVTKSNETLDQFYSWGELMLTDFDDIDKHLADADKVFTLLGDIHELDSVDYLTEAQQEALQRFFRNFSKEHNSELKQRFLNLWNKFGEIYNTYRSRLLSKNIAYEGMLYRDVIENVIGKESENPSTILRHEQTYVFVGFNLLNSVEEKLFMYLKNDYNAKFYWDYDKYYMTPRHEAGKYIAQYMRIFPNEISADNAIYDQFTKKKDITFISSPTEDLQARYIAQWLTPERIEAGRKTAIVLGDEALLETVLHCIPEQVKHVNITTGYPLAQSPISSLIRMLLILLQHKSYTLHLINGILRHPFSRYISESAKEVHDTLNEKKIYYPSLDDISASEELRNLFTPLNNTDDSKELNERLLWVVRHIARQVEKGDQFTHESLYRMYTILNRLSALMNNEDSEPWSVQLYAKLLQQIIQLSTIPFHGEPIEGIQIMGVLETRNLDFEHVLLLSCNEGKLPAKVNDSSFIPHSIRKAYELTTIDNKVAIYSYYFHRLLQRSNDIVVSYNNSTNEGQTGEMSRFMLQMMAESPLHINSMSLRAGQTTSTMPQETIEKTPEVIDTLLKRGYFSPSALGRYLRCPLSFFYRYITGITDNNESDEEEMDNMAFGNIFHRAAQLIYEPYVNRTVTKEILEGIVKEKGHIIIQKAVDKAFREKLFLITDDKRPTPRLGGLQVINREMIITFLINLLRFDMQATPFTIVGLEMDAYASMLLDTCQGEKKIRIGGSIDRLDIVTDSKTGIQTMRVIDYKTGSYKSLNMPSVEDIFNPEQISNHSDYYLQALMYSGIVAGKYDYPVSPSLLYVQQTDKKDYSPVLLINKEKITSIAEYIDDYRSNLKELISQILNPDIPFHPTCDKAQCEHCIYKEFCR